MADPGGFGSRFSGGSRAQQTGGFGGRFQPATTTKKSSGGRHGVLGFVENVGSDLYHAAVNTPAGVYYLGKGLATHPIGTLEQVAKSTYQDVRHPLRHPGYALLDVLGLLSAGAGTAARVGAVGKALEEGGTASRVAKAALSKPHPPERIHTVGDLKVKADYSHAPLTRYAQQGVDTLLKRAHDKSPVSHGGKAYERRVSKAITLNARYAKAAAEGPASVLSVMGRKLKPHEQMALRVVANEAPLDERIAVVKQRIAGASGAEAKRHEERLANLHRARGLLTVKDGKPALRPELGKLGKVYDAMKSVAQDREDLLKRIDAISEQAIQQHKTDVGRVALGQPRDEGALRFDTATAGIEHAPEHVLTKRLASIEGDYRKLVESAMGGKPGDYRRVTAIQNGRLKGVHATVREQLLSEAEKSVQETMRRNPEHPVVQKWQKKLAEADAIRAELTRRGDVAVGLAKGRDVPAPPPLFTASPDAVYVPEKVTHRGSKSLTRLPSLGQQGTIGHAQPPRSLVAGYSGKAAEHALERQDTTRLVAEANLEAQKYASALHVRDLVKQAGHAVPQAHDDVFVRLDNLKPHDATPLAVRRFIDNPAEAFVTPQERAGHYADFLRNVFVRQRDMTPADKVAFEKLAADGKGVWVSKTLLGDYAKPHAPLSATLGRTTSVIDATNNASRFAILYLKPAYALPNLLGNISLNLIQQGPIGFARTLRDVSRLSFQHPELTARIDALMGEGIARSISGGDANGRFGEVVQYAANKWSKGVDTPFRRAAWKFEASRAGYRTPAELEKLLTDPGLEDEMLGVTRRANREIIDYGRLGPREKEIVRRAVFFYPWIKGSTMYAGHLVAEHPVQAAALGQVGKTGREQSHAALGDVPSYLEGVFPVGGKLVNPTSAAILQTPAQVGYALSGLLTGDGAKVASLSNFLTPAATLAGAEVFRRNPGTGAGYPGGKGGLSIAKDVLGNRLPQTVLVQRIMDALHHKGQNRLYPPNILDALLQYGIGGIAPRKYNPAELARLYRSEQAQIKSGR